MPRGSRPLFWGCLAKPPQRSQPRALGPRSPPPPQPQPRPCRLPPPLSLPRWVQPPQARIGQTPLRTPALAPTSIAIEEAYQAGLVFFSRSSHTYCPELTLKAPSPIDYETLQVLPLLLLPLQLLRVHRRVPSGQPAVGSSAFELHESESLAVLTDFIYWLSSEPSDPHRGHHYTAVSLYAATRSSAWT